MAASSTMNPTAIQTPARFTALCAQGVLARPFAYEPTWLRFGVPPASALPRLRRALGALR